MAAAVVVGSIEGRTGLGRLGGQLLAWQGRRKAWAFTIFVPSLLLAVSAPLSAWFGGR